MLHPNRKAMFADEMNIGPKTLYSDVCMKSVFSDEMKFDQRLP